MPVDKVLYKGKEIIYVDFRGLNTKEMIDDVEKVQVLVLKENKPFLHFVDLNDAFAPPAFMESSYKFGKATKPIILKSAIIGVTGAKLILLKSYIRITGINMKAFKTKEEALDFLVE